MIPELRSFGNHCCALLRCLDPMIYRYSDAALGSLEPSEQARPALTAAGQAASAAHGAAAAGNVPALLVALEAGLDADTRCPTAGHTLLWGACLHGQAAVVELLASRGAAFDGDACLHDIDDPFTGTTVWRSCSPLWAAVHCGHTAVTKLLLELGASQRTNTPFRMAECHGGRESR